VVSSKESPWFFFDQWLGVARSQLGDDLPAVAAPRKLVVRVLHPDHGHALSPRPLDEGADIRDDRVALVSSLEGGVLYVDDDECGVRTVRKRGHRLPRFAYGRPGAQVAALESGKKPPDTGYCAYSLSGGDRMNDKPNWKVAHIDDIERRGRDIPVREQLGIHAFGINAFTPSDDGTLVHEHDEAGSGQQELYILLDGKATFEVDGEAVEAQPGTLVYVGPEARRKVTGDGTILVVGATPGEAYEGIDWGDAWQYHSESMTAYGEQRYADALESVRVALEHIPDHAGLHYNYACFATLAGDTSDDTFAHLRRAVELRPQFREDARRDDDFAAVRDDPRFEEALR
jgi:mannose-6-phosphate isomerase-like protein (cupin superfamily)